MALTQHVVYTCPECGHDGPHPVVIQQPCTMECRGCYAEVEVAY